MYQAIKRYLNYLFIHRPFEKSARMILKNNGLTNIKKFGTWKLEPVFSQYYVAQYHGNRVFCKVYGKTDYGCISREERILKYIDGSESTWLKQHTPQLVKTIFSTQMNILITGYIEGDILKRGSGRIHDLYKQMTNFLDEHEKLDIVHIDIRPSNFVVGKDGKIYLIDYGMAYAEKYKAVDELYRNMEFPEKLWGTGCRVYTPRDGMFDDAYAVLRTLKDMDPMFMRHHRREWIELNSRIGKKQVIVRKAKMGE